MLNAKRRPGGPGVDGREPVPDNQGVPASAAPADAAAPGRHWIEMRFLLPALAAFLLVPAVSLAADEFPKERGLEALHGISILPEPELARLTGGEFRILPDTAVQARPGLDAAAAVESLLDGIEEATGIRLERSEAAAAGNVILLEPASGSDLARVPAGAARREAYRLEAAPEKIRIAAETPAGLFYGVQTLLQLIEQGEGSAPGIEITDWPDMEFRAVHIDLWYHLDRPWYYRHLFRQLARYKINAAVFEFEDKFGYRSHPALAAPGALTHEQVRDLVRLARRHHIEIVPLVQTLGHVSFIAKHPEYQHLREVPMSNWQLCPLKKGTFPLIRDMITEVLEVVQPARYFHIGGDEARELGKGEECRRKWGDRAAVESYRLWLDFVCRLLAKHGKTAIVWDDMFLKHFSEADLAGLPENLIYMRWNYHTGKFEEQNRKILKLGYPVWIATSSQTMTPLFPDQRIRVFNNANFIPSSVALGIKGVLNTAWEDMGVHPETYWMGFLASAEFAWSSKKPTTEEYRRKFFRLFYGDKAAGLDKVYEILSRKGFLRREHGWTEEFAALDLPPLPDTHFHVESGWAEKHKDLVAEAKRRRPQYAEAVRILRENLSRPVKNRYNLEVLLLTARTALHFTDLVLRIAEIDSHLAAAEREHRAGDDQAAVNRYHRIGRIIDDLRREKALLLRDTVRTWEKSMYPRDFRHIPGGWERFVHQIGRDNYYANKTIDLSYIFEIEEKLPLFAYQQGLYDVLVEILRGDTPWDD